MQRDVADRWAPGALNENTEKNASLVFPLHFVACSFWPSDSSQSQLPSWNDSSVLRQDYNCVMFNFGGRVITLFDCSVFQAALCGL